MIEADTTEVATAEKATTEAMIDLRPDTIDHRQATIDRLQATSERATIEEDPPIPLGIRMGHTGLLRRGMGRTTTRMGRRHHLRGMVARMTDLQVTMTRRLLDLRTATTGVGLEGTVAVSATAIAMMMRSSLT